MQPHQFWQELAKILQGSSAEKSMPLDYLPSPAENEKIIGVLTDPIAISLWHLRTRLVDYVADYSVGHGLEDRIKIGKMSDIVFAQHSSHLREIKSVLDACQGAFWFYAKRQFPEAAQQHVTAGLRKGMQIVTKKQEDTVSRIISLLSKISDVAVVRLNQGPDDPSRN